MKKLMIIAGMTVLGTLFANAQAFFLDCSCLAKQSVLTTNACQAAIPDLCQFTNCWRKNFFFLT